MKKTLTFSILALLSVTASAQKWHPYGVERQMPVFLDYIKEELTYPMAWQNNRDMPFKEWRDSARNILIEAMMAAPPRATDYKAEIFEEEQRDGYKARKVQLNLSGHTRVNAYLLVPDTPGPHPGLVLFHDHGGHYLIGKEKMIRPFGVDSIISDDADKWAEQCYGGQFVGDYLAKQGYAVICSDAIFWGERGRKEGVDKRKLGEFAGNLLGLGRCMSGLTTFEDIYLTEYFSSLPFVDPTRIGCMGFSMGAYRAWMLSAATDLISAGASVCWMTTTDSQFSWEHGRENGGFTNTLPSIRLYMDHPHIASIACPKPMLFINGDSDKLFHPDGSKAAFATMREVWQTQGADSALVTELWPMPHYCGPEVQQRVAAFFNDHLKK